MWAVEVAGGLRFPASRHGASAGSRSTETGVDVRFYWLLLGVLAVWRLTHLLHAEDGPADLLVRLRRAAGEGLWGQLLDCFYCLSVWVAAPVALVIAASWMEAVLLWLALSGGASLLEQATAPKPGAAATYFEDPEV
ncbi:MAG: DUF1360 domain-containing protein [bacterium]|nr:DUF1360 domain-containing protein [bacterium]